MVSFGQWHSFGNIQASSFWLGHSWYGTHWLQSSPFQPLSHTHLCPNPSILVQVPWMHGLLKFLKIQNSKSNLSFSCFTSKTVDVRNSGFILLLVISIDNYLQTGSSHKIPSHVSSHWQVWGLSPHVPCIHPGRASHWSQLLPSQPWKQLSKKVDFLIRN